MNVSIERGIGIAVGAFSLVGATMTVWRWWLKREEPVALQRHREIHDAAYPRVVRIARHREEHEAAFREELAEAKDRNGRIRALLDTEFPNLWLQVNDLRSDVEEYRTIATRAAEAVPAMQSDIRSIDERGERIERSVDRLSESMLGVMREVSALIGDRRLHGPFTPEPS